MGLKVVFKAILAYFLVVTSVLWGLESFGVEGKASVNRPVQGNLQAPTHPPTASPTHPQVQAALDWQLPDHTCGNAPKIISGPAYTNDTHETVTSEVDHYTRSRFERKKKRWDKCIAKYNKGLIKDFGKLKDSVKHGMTQAQANQVLGKLKLIQDTIASTKP